MSIAAPSWSLLFTHLMKVQIIYGIEVLIFSSGVVHQISVEANLMQIFVKVTLYTSRPTNNIYYEPIWKYWWNLIVVLSYIAVIVGRQGEPEYKNLLTDK